MQWGTCKAGRGRRSGQGQFGNSDFVLERGGSGEPWKGLEQGKTRSELQPELEEGNWMPVAQKVAWAETQAGDEGWIRSETKRIRQRGVQEVETIAYGA